MSAAAPKANKIEEVTMIAMTATSSSLDGRESVAREPDSIRHHSPRRGRCSSNLRE